MYPNFDNKQDRSSKRQDLLARIERDQRLEAMKREAYANAIWATDSEESKLKDATETGDTLTRILDAMKAAASSSEKKNPPGVFSSVGEIYDAMGDASGDASGDAPATDEPILQEPMQMIEEKREPDEPREPSFNPDEFRKGITTLFNKSPFLSNVDFKPVIIKDGQIQEHNYIVRHTDGNIATKNGTKVPANNELLQYVDWEATYLSVKDRTESLEKLYKGIQSAMIRPLFKNWKAKVRAAVQGKAFDDQLGANDDQLMESVFNLSPEERAEIIRSLPPPDEDELMMELSTNRESAIKKYVPDDSFDQFMESVSGQTNEEIADTIMKQSIYDRDELMSSMSKPLNRKLFLKDLGKDDQEAFFDLENDTKKRMVDSTVSTDTPDQSYFKDKAQQLFDSIDGMESLQIKPYVMDKTGNIKESTKVYLGPKMEYYSLKTNKVFNTADPGKITSSINWEATLNLVIHELGIGARALTNQAKYESSPKKRANTMKEVKHILAMIKQVDPKQGAEQEALSAFPITSFDTPAARPKQEPTISAEKKDFVYERPAGKGLVGRGLRGAGTAGARTKNRAYNLADIEGSGKASDLKYKRLGTKFIRKADLNNNRLKLVFPNRTSVGAIRAMSPELTEMVKDLLYNDNISQQAYRALSVEDQRVFYEIVQKPHVNHTLQTPMIDPRIELKAEFDKLRGEIALGNDNPDMLRELYRLATDMFEQKMITNKEFKSIMSALI